MDRYPSRSHGKEVIIQNARLCGPPGSVTRDPRDKPADPLTFSFPTHPSLKKREFVSCLGFQKQHPSWSMFLSQAYLWRLPAAASPDTHTADVCARHVIACSKGPSASSRPHSPQRASRTAFCMPFLIPASLPPCAVH